MLRHSTAADCRQIYQLICQQENTVIAYDDFQAIYNDQLTDRRYYAFVYEENQTVAGFLSLRLEKQLHRAAAVAEITECIVAPACRSRGLGHKLLNQAIILAQIQGCCQLEVACRRQRPQLHVFYRNNSLKNTSCKFALALTQN